MTYENLMPSESDIQNMGDARMAMLTAGTEACEFILNNTVRDNDTGELRIIGDVPFDPELSRKYYGTFTTLESSGLDTKAALGVTRDEVGMLRQTLFDGASCD